MRVILFGAIVFTLVSCSLMKPTYKVISEADVLSVVDSRGATIEQLRENKTLFLEPLSSDIGLPVASIRELASGDFEAEIEAATDEIIGNVGGQILANPDPRSWIPAIIGAAVVAGGGLLGFRGKRRKDTNVAA